MIAIDISYKNTDSLEIIDKSMSLKYGPTKSREFDIDGIWDLILSEYKNGWYASISKEAKYSPEECKEIIASLILRKIIPVPKAIYMGSFSGSKVTHVSSRPINF